MEEIQAVTQKAQAIPDQARQINIIDAETYKQAGELLLAIKDLRKEIDAAFDPIIAKAHAAHKEAVAQKKRADEPLVMAERLLKPQMRNYDDAQERLRRAEEERIAEELRKQEEERKLQEAVDAEARGAAEEAEAIISEPVNITPPTVEKETPKVAGVSFRINWKFRVVDETKIPRKYLMIDMAKIGKEVREKKDKTDIPGIKAYLEKDVYAGRR